MFPIATLSNYHKFSYLKQYKFISLYFLRSNFELCLTELKPSNSRFVNISKINILTNNVSFILEKYFFTISELLLVLSYFYQLITDCYSLLSK